MEDKRYVLQPVGVVRSSLRNREECPKQGFEGAPDAWLEIEAAFVDALDGLTVGREILVLTWLHEGQRELLKVHPRGNPDEPLRGVFVTRSPDRPNPVGLHRVEVVEFQKPNRVRVRPLEVLDGTPIIDIKPVMRESQEA